MSWFELRPFILWGVLGVYLTASVWMSGAIFQATYAEREYQEQKASILANFWLGAGMVIFWPLVVWGLSDMPGAKTVSKVVLAIFFMEDDG
jgi:hypothetical protein